MRAILRRKLGRHVRRRTPRPGGEEAEAAVESQPGEEAHPLTPLIREEVRSRVREAVARLPEHERAVMEMRLSGMSSAEIAEVTGLEPATVRKRESRAAERLRSLLAERPGLAK